MRDALGRRKRYDPPEHDPKRDAKTLKITDNDRTIFCALRDHPQLPTTYLHLFLGKTLEPKTPKQVEMSQIIKSTTQRLSQLYYHGYLSRPEKQKAGENNKGQICTYALDARGTTWLQAEDLWSLYASSFKGHPSHQFYLSCVTASIHLATKRTPSVEYITKEQIFERENCPVKKLELEVNGETVKPDELFGIRFRDGEKGQTLYFVVELERAEKSSKRYREKFHPYNTIIKQRIYKDAWGINNLRVLVPSASRTLIEIMKEQVKDLDASGHFLFKHHRVIAKEWEVPPIMYDFYDEPWQTVGGEFWINRPKI